MSSKKSLWNGKNGCCYWNFTHDLFLRFQGCKIVLIRSVTRLQSRHTRIFSYKNNNLDQNIRTQKIVLLNIFSSREQLRPKFRAQQECIPVGCVPPTCCPYLPAAPWGGDTCPGGVPVRKGVPAQGGCTCPGRSTSRQNHENSTAWICQARKDLYYGRHQGAWVLHSQGAWWAGIIVR